MTGSLATITTSRLLTADDLAARWQVPVSQVYRLARDGKVPSVRLGKYVRFRLDAIETFEVLDKSVAGV